MSGEVSGSTIQCAGNSLLEHLAIAFVVMKAPWILAGLVVLSSAGAVEAAPTRSMPFRATAPEEATLTLEEILDVVAYVEAGGKLEATASGGSR